MYLFTYLCIVNLQTPSEAQYYIASNDGRKWNAFVKKRLWRLTKITRHLSRGILSSVRDTNTGYPEYEASYSLYRHCGQTISWLLVSQEINLFASYLISGCLFSCTWYLQLNEIKHLRGPVAVSFLSNRGFAQEIHEKKLRSELACILQQTAKTQRIHKRRATTETICLLKFQQTPLISDSAGHGFESGPGNTSLSQCFHRCPHTTTASYNILPNHFLSSLHSSPCW